MSRAEGSARRNATVLVGTVATVGLLFLYPTSTNQSRRAQRQSQPSGVVASGARSPAAGRASAPRTLTINGRAVHTRYGPVQVQITFRSGRIRSATAIVYPEGSGTDRQINSVAIPILQSETLQAQSAHVDTVSGATYTSEGYQRSLQAALDTAHRLA